MELAEELSGHWQAKGLRSGDRVALWLPNRPEVLIAYLACFRSGLIAVALDYRYQPEEAASCLVGAAASALVTTGEKAAALTEEYPSLKLSDLLTVGKALFFEEPLVRPDQPAPEKLGETDCLSTIFFTSGTTSQPKGVTHTSRRTVHRIEKFIEETRLDQDSVSLVAISLMKPLAFQLLAMALFYVGGTVVLLPRFTPEEFWEAYLKPPFKTILGLTPNLLASALDHCPVAQVRLQPAALWLVGGDRLPASLHPAFKSTLGYDLIELCGMTETGPYAMNPPFGEKRAGSVGVAPVGVALRLLDPEGNDVFTGQTGEVVVRTPDTMVGYWNDTLATFEVLRDGWMRTGDLARCDMEGYLWIEGRIKEMIVRDGSNISPLEIERLALSGSYVLSAVALGVPDPPHGEVVHLFVVLAGEKNGWPDHELRLRTLLKNQLRELALPSRIHLLNELPRNPGGKIDRAQLKKLAMHKAAGPELGESGLAVSIQLKNPSPSP